MAKDPETVLREIRADLQKALDQESDDLIVDVEEAIRKIDHALVSS